MQTVVIDAHGHMLGRLASIAAKQLLSGQQLVRSDLKIVHLLQKNNMKLSRKALLHYVLFCSS